jgi:hypothetical protein
VPVKPIALYFTQLHAIAENDRWWGTGFTDWDNVRRGTPQFPGHDQPRVPLGGYYDQSQESVVRRQVELAREYGIHGFSHYHYWFDGKQLLDTPTRLFLAAKDLKFNFCLAWANETWSRRWDGQDHEILIQQTHPTDKARWELHFQYLITAWTDPRAITVDGKPIFLIYRPHKIDQIGNLFDYWRERAHKHGLPGLYFVAMNQYGFADELVKKHFDATMSFQPQVSYHDLRDANRSLWERGMSAVRQSLPKRMPMAKAILEKYLDGAAKPTVIDYDRVWQAILDRPFEKDITTFPGAFPAWDNTPRYRNRALIYHGGNPEKFERYLRQLCAKLIQTNRPEEQLLFINAWNEWAEGAHLEPDERHGHGYLEAVRNAVRG